jgi:hypothetical protein
MHWTQTHEQEIFMHYIQLAQKPGWKAYVWHRVQQLDRDSIKTGFHVGIEKRFVAEMQKHRAAAEQRILNEG